VERLQDRFRAAHTQVLGISVDSKFCHAGWAQSLGGISYPLLADFNPKGAVAASYGLYLQDAGITDRATVIIDASGVVRHASSVTPSGERDIAELAALCEGVDREHGGDLPDFPAPDGLEPGARLFVKSACGFSAWTLQARDNLHLQQALPVQNVTEDPAAREQLKQLAGKDQAPCLVVGDKAMFESADIISHLVSRASDIG
jgi:glutaredoxin-related protein